MIRAAALCAAAGVGLSITEYTETAKWAAIIGVLLMILGLHRFGRMGPDEPIRFQLEPVVRKKKKKKPRPSAAPDTDAHSEAEAPPTEQDVEHAVTEDVEPGTSAHSGSTEPGSSDPEDEPR